MSADDRRKPENEAIIEELVQVKARGVPAGICGREWCEVCGNEGSFTGFAGAMCSHTAGGHFVCWSCRQERTRASSEEGTSPTLGKLILERGFRYCEGCGRKVVLPESTLEEALKLPFTCPACKGLDRGPAARKRYLEHEATKEQGLERAAARIRWAKAGIEEILEDDE